MGIKQKIAEAARLLEEASGEIEKSGLYISFEIKIAAQPQTVGIEVAPLPGAILDPLSSSQKS